MAATPSRDAKLVQLLNEAYTKEKQLELALSAHVQMTTRDDYAKRLKDHLKETKSHASQVSKRIKQLGGTPETVSLPGPDGLTKAAEAVSGALGKAKAAAQGPLHVVRGSGEQERMLHNARTEYQEEAWEIATYTIIDALAVAAGDKPTAKLARDILRQEERMQQFLATLLPELSADVAHDEIPVSELDGPGAHRTAADSKPKSSSSRATRAKSSSNRTATTSTRKKAGSGGSRAKSAGTAKKS
jgi:ferritin-like metal-binding protein YciE